MLQVNSKNKYDYQITIAINDNKTLKYLLYNPPSNRHIKRHTRMNFVLEEFEKEHEEGQKNNIYECHV